MISVAKCKGQGIHSEAHYTCNFLYIKIILVCLCYVCVIHGQFLAIDEVYGQLKRKVAVHYKLHAATVNVLSSYYAFVSIILTYTNGPVKAVNYFPKSYSKTMTILVGNQPDEVT